MSLNKFLKQNQAVYPFHMPGHKRNREFLDSDVLERDITEIHGADNLHNPEGLIKNLQAELAALYKSDESFLMVNGSSGGIIAAIMAVCGDGDAVLIARNSHISVFNGLIMSGAVPVYVNPQTGEEGFCLGVEPKKIGLALEANKGIKAVIITSPTYEGVCADIGEIARITHEAGALLIVDEAHGAHFGFHEYFPESSTVLGADIVIHSLHKTMPVLTQTSAMHVSGGRVNRIALKAALSMIQSSSPSYVFMSAAEEFIRRFRKDGKKYFDNYIDLLYSVRKDLSSYDAVKLLELGEIYDRSKLLLHTGCRLSGFGLSNIFREKFGLEMEMSSPNHVLALTSVADTEEGFARLSSAVKAVNADYRLMSSNPKIYTSTSFTPVEYEYRLTPRAAYQAGMRGLVRDTDYLHAAGELSAAFVMLYPPGVPLLVPGEIISTETIEILSRNMAYGSRIYGINDNRLKIISREALHVKGNIAF